MSNGRQGPSAGQPSTNEGPRLRSGRSTTTSLTGTLIQGRYELGRQLGSGGMGIVYEGVDRAEQRRVAVKVLKDEFAYHDTFRKRFLREARSASRIEHPNVVDILDYGIAEDDSVFIVMEYLEGTDLRALLDRRKRLPWKYVRDLLSQVCAGLEAVHDRGVIHRDVKPANCFIIRDARGNERVKVLDFGVAKVYDDTYGSRGLTGVDEVIGTVAYMAPELTMGEPAHVGSDIYALGVLAFEMLTGSKPFRGKDMFETMGKHMNEPPPRVRAIVPEIPPEMESIVMRTLAKKAEHRFTSMNQMRIALLGVPDEPALAPRHDVEDELPTLPLSSVDLSGLHMPRSPPSAARGAKADEATVSLEGEGGGDFDDPELPTRVFMDRSDESPVAPEFGSRAPSTRAPNAPPHDLAMANTEVGSPRSSSAHAAPSHHSPFASGPVLTHAPVPSGPVGYTSPLAQPMSHSGPSAVSGPAGAAFPPSGVLQTERAMAPIDPFEFDDDLDAVPGMSRTTWVVIAVIVAVVAVGSGAALGLWVMDDRSSTEADAVVD